MSGQTICYKRVSTVGQSTERQLDGVTCDLTFEDKASGKDSKRPELNRMLQHVRKGDTVLCHSMDRLARNLDDLRKLVLGMTAKGVRVEFKKEGLVFTGEDSSMSKLLLSVMGAFAEFERSLILERQAEGIQIAKAKGVYKGRKPSLSPDQVGALRQRVSSGLPIAKAAREFGISRQTVYSSLKA